jgi:hypothetical protein
MLLHDLASMDLRELFLQIILLKMLILLCLDWKLSFIFALLDYHFSMEIIILYFNHYRSFKCNLLLLIDRFHRLQYFKFLFQKYHHWVLAFQAIYSFFLKIIVILSNYFFPFYCHQMKKDLWLLLKLHCYLKHFLQFSLY